MLGEISQMQKGKSCIFSSYIEAQKAERIMIPRDWEVGVGDAGKRIKRGEFHQCTLYAYKGTSQWIPLMCTNHIC